MPPPVRCLAGAHAVACQPHPTPIFPSTVEVVDVPESCVHNAAPPQSPFVPHTVHHPVSDLCALLLRRGHRTKRRGQGWVRGHFPYNEFTISHCATGAQRACGRGTMPRAPLGHRSVLYPRYFPPTLPPPLPPHLYSSPPFTDTRPPVLPPQPLPAPSLMPMCDLWPKTLP